MTKILKNSKYFFTLKNIDRNNLNKNYNITFDNDEKKFTTNINNLDNIKRSIGTTSFLDESKITHVCRISMIDFSTRENISSLNYNCFWCRHPFNTIPIGCPVNFVPSQATKQYYSNISKDIYTIKENITTKRKDMIKNNGEFKISENNYYETDGIFCSFNCCKAYINDNTHNTFYNNSKMLLMKMYKEIVKDDNTIYINPAPDWRILKEYGGHIGINTFRNNFRRIDYKNHGCVKILPLGHLFEEKIKF